MRIYPSPIVMDEQKPPASAPLRRRHRHAEVGNVSACAKFPRERALLPHHGLADAITPDHMFTVAIAAGLLRSDGNAMGTTRKHPSLGRTERIRLIIFLLSPTGLQLHGQSFRIRQSSAFVRAALPWPASCSACRHLDRRYGSSCLFGRDAIWREISGRRLVGRAEPRRQRMAGIRFSHVTDRSG